MRQNVFASGKRKEARRFDTDLDAVDALQNVLEVTSKIRFLFEIAVYTCMLRIYKPR